MPRGVHPERPKGMLRGVYPERGIKGILRFAQNAKRRAQHDKRRVQQYKEMFSVACYGSAPVGWSITSVPRGGTKVKSDAGAATFRSIRSKLNSITLRSENWMTSRRTSSAGVSSTSTSS